MNAAKLRAWWFEKQGISGGCAGDAPQAVLERAGWARSVGGANPYLTFFCRAGTSRAEADSAVADLKIHELPAARGCTYVVPERDFALALRLARGQGDPQDVGVAKRHLGVTEDELVHLQSSVVDALSSGPMDPKQIKEAIGDAARSLGEEGKKRGMTTTLPLALGLLQTGGHIRRIPIEGRLDQQRYRYAAWDPSPMTGYTKSFEEACADLAKLYFSWIGPATKASFQAISGLGTKAAEAAMAPLGLLPVEDGTFFVLPEERDAYEAFQVPSEPRYALASCLDSISHLHWGVKPLVDVQDAEHEAFGPKGLTSLGNLSDLESHPIYDRGRLVGVWEFDFDRQEIAWTSWIEPNDDLVRELRKMEEFARGQLGDVRSFSLDSPESRRPRIEAIRNAALALR